MATMLEKGQAMRKMVLAALAAAVATPALAADLEPMATKAPVVAPAVPVFDIAFGGLVQSDYNFRGISQSDRGPSAGGYIEPRFNILPDVQLYVGLAGWSTKLPTDPTGEFNIYGGIRPTFGPLSLDLGFIYYAYPKETQLFVDPTGTFLTTVGPGSGIFTLDDTDFWEVYAKAGYTFNDYVSIGGNFYYSPSWLNTGASGTFASATLKLTAPEGSFGLADVGAYLSGEIGYYWLGTSDAILGSTDYPDYATWNVGVGFTYKAITLDLRYYDSELSDTECYTNTGDPSGFYNGGTSNWCDATFIARLSFDTTLSALK
jgi:uncharacterized protein (TIGR02001 family)